MMTTTMRDILVTIVLLSFSATPTDDKTSQSLLAKSKVLF